jgi:hypothetical protein
LTDLAAVDTTPTQHGTWRGYCCQLLVDRTSTISFQISAGLRRSRSVLFAA